MAKELLEAFPQERFFAFFGKMGVGKTTLIKQLCLHLGVDDNVCSPTFAIVNEYRIGDRNASMEGDPVYHFDFYRLKNLAEAYDIGYEEYFYGDGLCVVEWADKIEDLLPEDAKVIRLAYGGAEEERIVEAEEN